MTVMRLTLVLLAAAPLLSGCVVAAATGAVVKTTGAVVSTTARTTGAVVGAAIPDREDDGEDDRDRAGQGESGGYPDTAAPAGGGYTRADAVADARDRR